MVEFEFSKLATRVRFPSPAPFLIETGPFCKPMDKIKNQIAGFLHRCGVSANFVTVVGLVCALASAFFVYEDRFILAGSLLILSGVLDLLDGAVARAAGIKNKFGGVLDSTLDRYGDGVVLGVILIYFAEAGDTLYAGLALSALLGSFSISYVRARAECEVASCRVGFWERGERLVYLALGLLLGNVQIPLWALGIFTHATVLQRLILSKRLLTAKDAEATGSLAAVSGKNLKAFLTDSHGRGSIFYWIKAAFWVFLVIFARV